MKRLATSKRTQVIAALAEGVSLNATSRLTRVSKVTILRLLEKIGCACAEYHNRIVRNLKVRRVHKTLRVTPQWKQGLRITCGLLKNS